MVASTCKYKVSKPACKVVDWYVITPVTYCLHSLFVLQNSVLICSYLQVVLFKYSVMSNVKWHNLRAFILPFILILLTGVLQWVAMYTDILYYVLVYIVFRKVASGGVWAAAACSTSCVAYCVLNISCAWNSSELVEGT